MKIALSVIISFALGFLAHSLIFHAPTTKDHWRALEECDAYVRNPTNWERDAGTGLGSVTVPIAVEPHLAALVEAGELQHVDLVLPTVPKSPETTYYWMNFCDVHKEFVYATGNPYSLQFPYPDAQPLHLNLWFRPADVAVAQTLVRDLEALAQEKKGAAPASEPDVSKLDPKQILDKVVEQYKTMQTYQSEGTVVEDLEIDGREMHTTTSFSMKLKKPNLYLIAWTRKDTPMPGMEQSGAVWNAGAQPYLYMGIGPTKTCSKMTSDEMAIAAATGISDGVAHTIPSLFFSLFGSQLGELMRLQDPKMEKIEKLDGEDCYVISGSSVISKKETLWISTKRFLILQWSRSHERPEGQVDVPEPEMTDQQLDEMLRMTGKKPTTESRAKMRDMMNRAREATKNVTIKGVSCERHSRITTPELKTAEFEFKVPEGTTFNESLFGSELDDES